MTSMHRLIGRVVVAVLLLRSVSWAEMPSVVVLPPRLTPAADASTRAAAELLCDRLATALDAQGIAQVVDRTQLDRVLDEKRLAEDPIRPMLSFDAMVRLHVNAPALVPEVQLSLVDLSRGNVLQEETFRWPVEDGDLPKMAGLCRAALQPLNEPPKASLKVRCLSVENRDGNPRTAPLALRLQSVFQESLARSERVTSIQHLEASSAKEESLLLLLGLSSLPGGRQFTPQSDVTIELRLREVDGDGKTFAETPVEISARLTRKATGTEQLIVTKGTVAEFDRAIADAWAKVSAALGDAAPQAAENVLDEMLVRRRQAEAELRAALAMVREGEAGRTVPKLRTRLAHAEAAFKLDPTFEDANCECVNALKSLAFREFAPKPAPMPEAANRILAQAVRYFDQFGSAATHRKDVHDACFLAVHMAMGRHTYLPGRTDIQLPPPTTVRMVQRVLDDALSFHPRVAFPDYRASLMMIVALGMQDAGIPQSVREQWVDAILQQAMRGIAEKKQSGDRGLIDQLQSDGNAMYLVAADLAVKDLNEDRARKLIDRLKERLTASVDPLQPNRSVAIRRVLDQSKDKTLVKEYDRWLQEQNTPAVRRITIRWPKLDAIPHYEGIGRHGGRTTTPESKVAAIHYAEGAQPRQPWAIAPLAEGNDRLYVLLSEPGAAIGWGGEGGTPRRKSPQCAYLPLTASGTPEGKPVPLNPPRRHFERWDSLTLLPQPQLDELLKVRDVVYLDKKLCLGTPQSGLVIFDSQTESWSRYGPNEGLPEREVLALHPLDERTLLCVGANQILKGVWYRFDLRSRQVTLLHRVEGQTFDVVPQLFWRNEDQWMGWCAGGLCSNLLGPKVQFRPIHQLYPHGWPGSDYANFLCVAECDGRLFATTERGLHEFKPDGSLVQSWWGTTNAWLVNMQLPGDCPLQSPWMVNVADMLAFVARDSVAMYDPGSDTWFGPVSPGGSRAVCTAAGLYLGSGYGMQFVETSSFLETAKQTGRAFTTAEYRNRLREVIEAMPRIEQAKVMTTQRQFAQAKRLLDLELAADANSVAALHLMGQINNVHCLNRPDEAAGYYRRLAQVSNDRDAAFTGLYEAANLLMQARRWQEAQTLVNEIDRRFPVVDLTSQDVLHAWRGQLADQLGKLKTGAEASH